MGEQLFEALFEEYYVESRERVGRIEEALLGARAANPEVRNRLLEEAKRELHTLKGNSGMMGLTALQELAHALEDQVAAPEAGEEELRDSLRGIDRFRRLLDAACGRGSVAVGSEVAGQEEGWEPGQGADSPSVPTYAGVRVSFAALDALLDLLSETVILRNRLIDTLKRGTVQLDDGRRISHAWHEVEAARQDLYRNLDHVQKAVLELRMVPLGTLFSRLRRIVYDESAQAGKLVELEVRGGETPLDKALLEVASEAVGHLVRNAVIHGIETTDERVACGKPREGRLLVAASALADEVLVDIQDDGRGIDREVLLEAARRRGIEVPPETDLHTLVFLPGLSTREGADTGSGRGMGTAAVAAAVRRRGGRVEVHSVPGRGTRVRIRLPLTASIAPALLVFADEHEYALPLTAVLEILSLAPGARHTVNGAGVIRWRGGLLPILDLSVAAGVARRPREEGYVVVIEAEGRLRGLLVEGIVGVSDVVVKSLDEVLGAPQGVAGCTILGDGRVIMILDPVQLARLSLIEERV